MAVYRYIQDCPKEVAYLKEATVLLDKRNKWADDYGLAKGNGDPLAGFISAAFTTVGGVVSGCCACARSATDSNTLSSIAAQTATRHVSDAALLKLSTLRASLTRRPHVPHNHNPGVDVRDLKLWLKKPVP